MSLYEIEGGDPDGPVLVALPGMGGTAFTFPMEAFEPLHNAGVRVLFASYNDAVDSMESMGRAVWDAILLAGIDTEVILLGYSMGGFVAQTMHELCPSRVAGMIMLSTTCFTLEDAARALLGHCSRSLKGLMQLGRSGPPEAMVSDDVFVRETAAIMAYMTGNQCEFLYNCSCPVLSIYGDNDRIIAVKSMAAMKTLADSTHFSEVVFKNCGHGLIYEEPEKFASTVLNWMAALELLVR